MIEDKLFNELKKLSIENHEKYVSYLIKIELDTDDEETKRVYKKYKSKESVGLLSDEINDALLDIRFEDLNSELKDIREVEKDKEFIEL